MIPSINLSTRLRAVTRQYSAKAAVMSGDRVLTYLPAAGENGDGGGFNGIGARWMARFVKDRGEQATFEAGLQKNAEAAWQARRLSDDLPWCRWPQPTPEDLRNSWGCSSAVVIMQVVRPPETAKADNSK